MEKLPLLRVVLATLAIVLFLSSVSRSHAICPGSFDVQAGVIDEFALPEDPATPLGNLVGFSGGGIPGGDFDEPTPGNTVAHTFTGYPTPVCEAELEFRVELLDPSIPDTLYLGSEGDAPDPYIPSYYIPIRDLPGAGAWLAGDKVTFVLDLASLPPSPFGVTSVMDDLADGTFDFAVGWASRVDYAILRVCGCTTAVEEASWSGVKELFR